MTNVALVVLDTLRKDAFDRHFDWLPGRTFEQAYSTTHWTVPAHVSLFTGRYPSEISTHAKNLYFDCETPALAELLRDARYTTRGYSANPNVSGHFSFDRGFDEFTSPAIQQPLNDDELYDWRKLGRDAEGTWDYLAGVARCILGDSRTVPSLGALLSNVRQWRTQGLFGVDSARWALDEIRSTDFSDREFLFVNLMEAHQPYEVPESYRTVAPPEMVPGVGDVAMGDIDPRRTRVAYDDAARYLSEMYRRIFEELTGSFDVIITLSDHGEMLGEQGYWGHEYGVFPQLTHVPLSVYDEGSAGTCESPVSLTDVFETVVCLAGVETDGHRQDLTGRIDERQYHTEYHGLTPWSEARLEDAGYSAGEFATYDGERYGCIAPDYYGYESRDGVRETGTYPGPETVAERLSQIRNRAGGTETRRTDIPDGVRTHLEQLGYR